MDLAKWVTQVLPKHPEPLIPYTKSAYRDISALVGLSGHRLHVVAGLPAVTVPHFESSADESVTMPNYKRLLDLQWREHCTLCLDKVQIGKLKALCALVDKVRFEINEANELIVVGTNDLVDGRRWDSHGWLKLDCYFSCNAVPFDGGASAFYNSQYIADALCNDNPKRDSHVYWKLSTDKLSSALKLAESNTKRTSIVMSLRSNANSN